MRSPNWRKRHGSAASILDYHTKVSKKNSSLHKLSMPTTPRDKHIKSKTKKGGDPYRHKDVITYLNTLTPRKNKRPYIPILDEFSPERKFAITEKML